MKSCEGIGKTIEKAIEDALEKLKAKKEDVDIKILDEGGIFKKAKVLVTISEDSIDEYQNKNYNKENSNQDESLDIKAIFADSEVLKKPNKEFEKIENKHLENEQKLVKKEEKKSSVDLEEKNGVNFIKGILNILKIDCDILYEEKEDQVYVKVEGGSSGDIIGYRGECLNAIQYIASVIENDFKQRRKKFILDIENYRQKREETLKELAHRIENKVIKTKKSMKLEPMNANERRIIHTELQKSEFVTTISKGNEPSRYIVVSLKEEVNNGNY